MGALCSQSGVRSYLLTCGISVDCGSENHYAAPRPAPKTLYLRGIMYSTFAVHLVRHFDDAEVVSDLPLEKATSLAERSHGVVVERVDYDLAPSTAVPAPRG